MTNNFDYVQYKIRRIKQFVLSDTGSINHLPRTIFLSTLIFSCFVVMNSFFAFRNDSKAYF
jgi:hypothetical protein